MAVCRKLTLITFARPTKTAMAAQAKWVWPKLSGGRKLLILQKLAPSLLLCLQRVEKIALTSYSSKIGSFITALFTASRKDRVNPLFIRNQILPLGFLLFGSFYNFMHKVKKWNIFQQIFKDFFKDISDMHLWSGSRWLPANFYTGPAFKIRNTN